MTNRDTQMTKNQFAALAELIRMRPAGASYEAARLILVDQIPTAQAAGQAGISYQGAQNAATRIKAARKLAQQAIGNE